MLVKKVNEAQLRLFFFVGEVALENKRDCIRQ